MTTILGILSIIFGIYLLNKAEKFYKAPPEEMPMIFLDHPLFVLVFIGLGYGLIIGGIVLLIFL